MLLSLQQVSMLTRPDFTQKKLVHIGNYDSDVPNDLKFSNNTIQLFRDGEKIDQISCHLVFSICIGASKVKADFSSVF